MLTRTLRGVTHEKQEYYVAGRADSSGLSFWIEKPAGKLWRHITVPPSASVSVDIRSEIIALTHDDPSSVLADVAMNSGWFDRTGRTVKHPINEINDVWRITDACRLALGLPSLSVASSSAVDVSSMSTGFRNSSTDVTAALAFWIRRLPPSLGVTSAVVLAPDPYSEDCGKRMLVAAYPAALASHELLLISKPGPLVDSVGSRQQRAAWFLLDDAQFQEGSWQRALARVGYKAAVRILFPATAGRAFECILLGSNRLFDAAEAALTAWHTLNVWPDVLDTIAKARSPLSPKETECLMLSANGITGVEAAKALDCTERTVRAHLTNAFAKLGTTNKVAAIQKAHLLGLF
jgi:DNA-binding CsgD family transcriptional regulator